MPSMTVEQFQDALDRFGSDLGDWPPDLAGRADTLLRASPEARRLRSEMAEVEALLACEPAPPAPSGLAARICAAAAAAAAPERPRPRPSLRDGLRWLLRPGLLWPAVLGGGLAAGMVMVPAPMPTVDIGTMFVIIF